jgi:hypothetical protein
MFEVTSNSESARLVLKAAGFEGNVKESFS